MHYVNVNDVLCHLPDYRVCYVTVATSINITGLPAGLTLTSQSLSVLNTFLLRLVHYTTNDVVL